jgi:hypothetical protein
VNVAPAGAENQSPAVAAITPATPKTRGTRIERFIPPHNNSPPGK